MAEAGKSDTLVSLHDLQDLTDHEYGTNQFLPPDMAGGYANTIDSIPHKRYDVLNAETPIKQLYHALFTLGEKQPELVFPTTDAENQVLLVPLSRKFVRPNTYEEIVPIISEKDIQFISVVAPIENNQSLPLADIFTPGKSVTDIKNAVIQKGGGVSDKTVATQREKERILAETLWRSCFDKSIEIHKQTRDENDPKLKHWEALADAFEKTQAISQPGELFARLNTIIQTFPSSQEI